MRLSSAFIPTLRKPPKNVRDGRLAFAVMGGYARPGGAMLPLGVRVTRNICSLFTRSLFWTPVSLSGGCGPDALARAVFPDINSFRDLPRVFFDLKKSRLLTAAALALTGDGFEENLRRELAEALESLGVEAFASFPESVRPAGSFSVPDENGGTELCVCPACRLADEPDFVPRAPDGRVNPVESLEKVHTPDVRSIEDVTAFFDAPPEAFIKSLLFMACGRPVMALVRGDRTLSVKKLGHALGCDVRAATADEVKEHAGVEPGFVGPLGGHGLEVCVDLELMDTGSYITGACENDYHVRGLTPGRDFEPALSADLSCAGVDADCPVCGEKTDLLKGRVLANTEKGREAKQVTTRDGKRAEARSVEIRVDLWETFLAMLPLSKDESWAWPERVAPYPVEILLLNAKDEAGISAAEALATDLDEAGIDYIYDDRPSASPGEKFNDADFIGAPVRVVIGKKKIAQGICGLQFVSAEGKTATDESPAEVAGKIRAALKDQ